MSDRNRVMGVLAREANVHPPFGLQTYFFEDMVRHSADLPVEIFFFSPTPAVFESGKASGFQFRPNAGWEPVVREVPVVLYERYTPKSEAERALLKDSLQAALECGHRFLNPVGLADLLRDKPAFHRFLVERAYPTLTAFSTNVAHEQLWADWSGEARTVFLKPVAGSNGIGISVLTRTGDDRWVIRSEGQANRYFDKNGLKDWLDRNTQLGNWFLQPAARVPRFESRPVDLRVLVQPSGKGDYGVTGMAYRAGRPGGWVSNLSAGGDAFAPEQMKAYLSEHLGQSVGEMRRIVSGLCLDIARSLDAELGPFAEVAFDLLPDAGRGWLVLEANARPARWVFQRVADNVQGKDHHLHQEYTRVRALSTRLPVAYACSLHLPE